VSSSCRGADPPPASSRCTCAQSKSMASLPLQGAGDLLPLLRCSRSRRVILPPSPPLHVEGKQIHHRHPQRHHHRPQIRDRRNQNSIFDLDTLS
jgi:hypothetical protein